MDAGEASRQYQAALEYRRTMRAAVEGCVSFEEELAGLDVEVAAARSAVVDAIIAEETSAPEA